MEKPETAAGKFVGSMCAVFSIFTLILPIPIVVNSFSSFYRNRLWRNEVAFKRRERLTEGDCVSGVNGTNGGSRNNGKDAGLMELNGVAAN